MILCNSSNKHAITYFSCTQYSSCTFYNRNNQIVKLYLKNCLNILEFVEFTFKLYFYFMRIYCSRNLHLAFISLCFYYYTEISECNNNCLSNSNFHESSLFSISSGLQKVGNFDLKSKSVSCSSGHWPSEYSCYFDEEKIWIDDNIVFTTAKASAHKGLKSLGMIDNSFVCPKCTSIISDSVFIPLPYDSRLYHSDGSNFYVIHVDILIPLWKFLKDQYYDKNKSSFRIILFVTNNELGIDLKSSAFISTQAYWISSIQQIFENEIILMHINSSLFSKSKSKLL